MARVAVVREEEFGFVDLKRLKDRELHEVTLSLVAHERRISVQVLEHLREIELRRVYVPMGYSSLFDYCMRELKYSDSQSYRRIASMRLMCELPVLKEKIESGSLNVSTITKAVGVFRAKAKTTKVSSEQKLELLTSLENKSNKQIETILHQEVAKTHTQITLQMSDKLRDKLRRVRDLSAHHNVDAGLEALIEFMADQLIKKLDPTLKKTRVKKTTETTFVNMNSRVDHTVALTKVKVSASSATQAKVKQSEASNCTQTDSVAETVTETKQTASAIETETVTVNRISNSRHHTFTETHYPSSLQRKQTWQKYKSKCHFKNCGSTYSLEIDHIKPYALDGKTTLGNLRLLCRTHNQYRARQTFG